MNASANPVVPGAVDWLTVAMLAITAAFFVIGLVSILRAKLDAPIAGLWVLGIVILPVVGPIVWFVVGRPRRAVG